MSEFLYWYVKRPLESLRLRFVYALPRWLVYWCAIRLFAHATMGKYGNEHVDDIRFDTALKRWQEESEK